MMTRNLATERTDEWYEIDFGSCKTFANKSGKRNLLWEFTGEAVVDKVERVRKIVATRRYTVPVFQMTMLIEGACGIPEMFSILQWDALSRSRKTVIIRGDLLLQLLRSSAMPITLDLMVSLVDMYRVSRKPIGRK